MLEKPAFIQGLFSFRGAGLDKPVPLSPGATYSVPFDKRAQMIYLRAGNPLPEMIYLVLVKSGVPMRYFPVGAKSSVHVPLAVVENLAPETELEVLAAGPGLARSAQTADGLTITLVLDIGFMEIG